MPHTKERPLEARVADGGMGDLLADFIVHGAVKEGRDGEEGMRGIVLTALSGFAHALLAKVEIYRGRRQ